LQQLNGLLLIDKPTDLTSHDVVARLRRILKQKSVGHTGTLDPLATGLMVMVLGDATKLSDYLIAEDKAYLVTVRLGLRTDTLDRTGEVLSRTECRLSATEIAAAVEELSGEFDWPVPLFSATKVDGKKLYDYGREGRESPSSVKIDLPIKTMAFSNPVIEDSGPDWVRLRLECSKGSFVRTWADQLGMKLGVGGVVEELRRLRVGSWRLETATSLEALESGGELGAAYIPMGQALPGLKAIMAGPREVKLVGHGQIPREIENRLIVEQKHAYETGKSVFVKVISQQGDLLAILAAEPGQGLKIRRVFRGFA
jgi:tRNA pseudouridine55 synthase